jgi:hypothetical protein
MVDEQGVESMVADRSHVSDGLYMTKEQYFALDEATDGQYEFYNGYVIMLTPPSSAYDDGVFIDMSGGSIAHSAICARLAFLIGQGLPPAVSLYSPAIAIRHHKLATNAHFPF